MMTLSVPGVQFEKTQASASPDIRLTAFVLVALVALVAGCGRLAP